MMQDATLDAGLDDEDALSADPEDMDGEGEGEEGEGGGLNAKKILLFVIVPLFLIVGGGGAAYFTGALDGLLKGGGDKTAEKSHDDHDDGHGGKTASASSAHFLEIPNMTVNLSSGDGQPRYLRLKVQLELESAGDLSKVEAVMPRVVDQFQTYLRELRVKDLRGSAGIYRLQTELLTRVNAAAYPTEVKDVLFQEILIQ